MAQGCKVILKVLMIIFLLVHRAGEARRQAHSEFARSLAALARYPLGEADGPEHDGG